MAVQYVNNLIYAGNSLETPAFSPYICMKLRISQLLGALGHSRRFSSIHCQSHNSLLSIYFCAYIFFCAQKKNFTPKISTGFTTGEFAHKFVLTVVLVQLVICINHA